MEIIKKNIILLVTTISYLLSMVILLQQDISDIIGIFYYFVATTLTDYGSFIFVGFATYFWGIVFVFLYIIANGIVHSMTKSNEELSTLIYYWLVIYPLLFILVILVFQDYCQNYFNWIFVIMLSFPISYYIRKIICLLHFN